MAEFEQHIGKYRHNDNFVRFGISSARGPYNDWEVTARFYASIHLIEAVLCKELSLHSPNHAAWDSNMSDHPDLFPRECAKNYASLKALARKARYETGDISAAEALKAQSCLDELTSHYERYIQTVPV